MTSRYSPPCNEGDVLTRCVLYQLKVWGGEVPGCSADEGRNLPTVLPQLRITKLPIEQDPLCGDCDEHPMPDILQDWLDAHPESNLWNIYDDENFIDLLMVYICENSITRSLIISYSAPLLDRSITCYNQRWELATYDESWNNIASGRASLTDMGSMPCDECVCLQDPNSGSLNTCPQYGMMPWWQSPSFKYGSDGSANALFCTIFPPTVPDFRCGLLYETSRYVDKIGTAFDVLSIDFPTTDPFGFVPIEVENWELSREFLIAYQAWVDKNKNNPQFESEFGDAVIIFYGWIKGGLNKTTNLPEWDGNPSISKMKLETWGLDSRKKLVRLPVSWQQNPGNYTNKVIYLVPNGAIKDSPVLTNKNLLITFNMNTCAVQETIVTSQPDIAIPETLVVKYIPNTDKLLSESNPEEYRALVREYEDRFDCNKGTCCVILKDSEGYLKHDCKVVNESDCSVEGMNQFYSNDPTFVGLTVVSTTHNGSVDNCNNVDCEWELPLPKVLGTCCIPEYSPDGDWGCMVTSKEECRAYNGFWEEPQPNGVGGINPPSCTDRGIKVEPILSTDSSVRLLGPRKCSDSNNSDPNMDDSKSACCWLVPSKVGTDVAVSDSLAYTKTIQKRFQDPISLTWNNISTTLFMLNDGSTIKLCFPSTEILNKVYPITTTEQARNTKIESEFSIVDKNSDNQFYKVQFKKIEGSCIILTTIKS